MLNRRRSKSAVSPEQSASPTAAEQGFVPSAGESVLVMLVPDRATGTVRPRVQDPRLPALTVTDQGVTRGDGIFETMMATATGAGAGAGADAGANGQRVGNDGGGYHLRKSAAHLARLTASAEVTQIPVPVESDWRAAIAAGLEAFGAANPGRSAVVKLVATRGPEAAPGGGHYGGGLDAGGLGSSAPSGAAAVEQLTGTYWVLVSPVSEASTESREHGLKVLFLDRGYESGVQERAPWLLLGAKTLSYAVNMAAMRYAKAQGADDVIFTSSDGKVLEGPTSTVLMARRIPRADGTEGVELVTPLRRNGILPGTSQGVIFAAAERAGWELGYGPLVPDDLLDADGVWLVSSVRLVAPITELDGVQVPVDQELTEQLSAFLAEDRDPGSHGPLD